MSRLVFLLSLLLCSTACAEKIKSTKALVKAISEGAENSTIEIEAGLFELSAPLEPKPGMTIKGAGVGKTVITHSPAWNPSTEKLPDSEVNLKRIDTRAYLIRLQDRSANISISNLSLRGPKLHGAIFGLNATNLQIHNLQIEETLYCGIRLFYAKKSKIHDCEFIDAGGKWKRGGKPGTDGGISGGAIFVTWPSDCVISNNRIRRKKTGKQYAHFGIKGRGGRNIHIHHNTIDVNFSIEFPFEGADRFQIDHNILNGVISIPKHAGGKVPTSGSTFDIHHNYFTTSYAIEFVRNGVEIHHNLFDFDLKQDGGNLISGFGKAAAEGPAEFHNNLISNPGRGVIWINEPYNKLVVRNNHIISRTTATPRKEGLFGLNAKSDFSKVKIVDNIIECRGLPRPLLRTDPSYESKIENNRLINVSDTGRYKNRQTGSVAGLEKPLKFACGKNGELKVDGWKTSRAPSR